MGIRQICLKIFRYVRKTRVLKGEMKNLQIRRDEWENVILTEDNIKETNAFFKQHYGKKVPLHWHKMYSNYTGNFDKRFFPEHLFSTKLEEILNPYFAAQALGNKAFNPQYLFNDSGENIRVPKMYLLSCGKNKWDADGQLLPAQEAVAACKDLGGVIMKPTVESMGARGVRLLDLHNGIDAISGQTVEDVFREYKKDFIIQERVRNHESISRIYPDSVNTLRVITYLCDEKVNVAPLSMRIGMGGRIVDNGGIFIGVTPEGELYPTGFSKKHITRYNEHPDTGVVFDGYKIEGVPEMVAAARKLHARLPQMGMLSWDMCYDENGNVVVIECNTLGQSVWFPQMVTGKPIFGEHTAKMLEKIK